MRRVPTTALLPGMKVGHPVYNSLGEILINQDVILDKKYIRSLSRLDIPALYIEDDSLPESYVEDVIDEKSRIAAIKLTRTILKGPAPTKSPLDKALMDDAKTTINDIIDQLINNSSLMVNLVDIRSLDDYLFGHSVNVCVLSLITGISLGYGKRKLMNLGMGALLHDIGKTLIPLQVLNKPGALNKEEYNLIKQHSEFGYKILLNNETQVRKISALVALQHHERYNGEGYPKGILGNSIQEYSQIVGIADVYDAMTADRVYREAYPPKEVYELLACSGNFLFDHRLVKSFLANIAAYPTGSMVQLSSNETALVTGTHKGLSLYPHIKIIYDRSGNRLEVPVDIEMCEQNTLTIVKTLKHTEIEDLKLNDIIAHHLA